MATKTPAYRITTADDKFVDQRTEGKAADKLAEKLTTETGLAHRVYTPTGKLRLETEVIEPEPADDIPAVDINDVIAEAAAEEAPAGIQCDNPDCLVMCPMCTPEAFEEDAAEEPEPVTEETAEEDAQPVDDFLSYATVMDQLKDSHEAVRNAAKAEWTRRLEIYRQATNDKDPAKRIVGPAMAAALERGETTDGRTRAALIRRGLVEPGDGLAFTVNEAGRGALAAAVAAVM